MLLTDNIAIRYREWRDQRTKEPDLVPRLRRLWNMDRLELAPVPRPRRFLPAVRHRAALEVSRGL